MRLIIIPSDGFVSVDDICFCNINISLPEEYHAIQWYDTEGEIEIVGSNGKHMENIKITSIDEFLPIIEQWKQAKLDEENRLIEQQKALEESQQLLNDTNNITPNTN